MSVKKILFYTNYLDPHAGGAAYSQHKLIEEFLKRDIDVKMIVNKNKERELDLGIPVICLNAKYGDFERPFTLKKIIEREKPDAVFSNMLPQNVTLSITKYLTGKVNTKFIGITRNSNSYIDYGSKIKIPYRLLVKKLYENLDYIIAISEDVKNDLIKTFFIKEGKIKIIYNGINIEEVLSKSKEPLPEEYERIYRENKIIINVGRLLPQKNQKVLIEVLEVIKKKIKNVKLFIVGTGKLEKELKALAKEKKLENDVIFTGFQENPFNFMKRADVFVLSSEYEGGPRVLKESMILGVPVVAFKTTGIFNDKKIKDSLLLIPPYDVKKFAETIINLLQNKQLYEFYKNKSLEIADEFDIKKTADKYLELI